MATIGNIPYFQTNPDADDGGGGAADDDGGGGASYITCEKSCSNASAGG